MVVLGDGDPLGGLWGRDELAGAVCFGRWGGSFFFFRWVALGWDGSGLLFGMGIGNGRACIAVEDGVGWRCG